MTKTSHEEMGNLKEAEDKYKKLLTQVPSDPNILQRLGHICAKQEDEIAAHQYYMEVISLYSNCN
jgi:Flp pilus assembly protein TadD